MPCPNCTHTLMNLGTTTNGIKLFWCASCGTLQSDSLGFSEHSVPSLVERCQRFGETLGPSWEALWKQLGIEEAIWPPGARKP